MRARKCSQLLALQAQVMFSISRYSLPPWNYLLPCADKIPSKCVFRRGAKAFDRVAYAQSGKRGTPAPTVTLDECLTASCFVERYLGRDETAHIHATVVVVVSISCVVLNTGRGLDRYLLTPFLHNSVKHSTYRLRKTAAHLRRCEVQ